MMKKIKKIICFLISYNHKIKNEVKYFLFCRRCQAEPDFKNIYTSDSSQDEHILLRHFARLEERVKKLERTVNNYKKMEEVWRRRLL